MEWEALTYRLDTNGTLDNSFGSGGVATAAAGYNGRAIALQADGKIVIAGEAGGTYPYCERLLPNGIPDSSFGTNGIVTGHNGLGAWGVAIAPDGKIVIGYVSFAYYFMATRYLPNGTLDTSFNHTGSATIIAGDSWNDCLGIQVQADGKVILAGSGTFGSLGENFALVRFNTDGSVDSSYGNSGVLNIAFSGSCQSSALCLTPDGKILVTGYSNAQFALARIDANGIIDSAFGNNGQITTAIQDGDDMAKGLAMQGDGKIVVAGYSSNGSYDDRTLARYQAGPAEGIAQVSSASHYAVLSPNPSTGRLYIKRDCVNHIINITAINMDGKQIVTIQVKESIPLSKVMNLDGHCKFMLF